MTEADRARLAGFASRGPSLVPAHDAYHTRRGVYALLRAPKTRLAATSAYMEYQAHPNLPVRIHLMILVDRPCATGV